MGSVSACLRRTSHSTEMAHDDSAPYLQLLERACNGLIDLKRYMYWWTMRLASFRHADWFMTTASPLLPHRYWVTDLQAFGSSADTTGILLVARH